MGLALPPMHPPFAPLILSLAAAAAARPTTAATNVLVLVADDLGVDVLASYGLGSDLPVTPRLDALAAEGLLFRRAWANPLCSPTRATLLTGRYALRHGVGDVVNETTEALPLAETTIPELLDLGGSGWSHAAIGKWHLGNATVGGLLSPNLAGFAHFDGSLRGHLGEAPGLSYTNWPRVTNGTLTISQVYNTTFVTDAALDWIAAASEPWFLWVAYHSPHSPFHAPPAGTYSEDLSGLDPLVTPRPFYKAMVESLDFEIGRLLDGLGPALEETLVVFLGDNGTPRLVTVPPFPAAHGKGTPYQGGVHVPLVVRGPGVARPGAACDALVDASDLLPTVCELAGIDPLALVPGLRLDGHSLLPLLADPDAASPRGFAFAERFSPVGATGLATEESERAARDERFKLVVRRAAPAAGGLPVVPARGAALLSPASAWSVSLELYDLWSDPFEADELLGRGPLSAAGSASLRALLAAVAGLENDP